MSEIIFAEIKNQGRDRFVLNHSMTLLSKTKEKFKFTINSCVICCINFQTQKEYLKHIKIHIKKEQEFKTLWIWCLEPQMKIFLDIQRYSDFEDDLSLVLESMSAKIDILRVFILRSNATIEFLGNDIWPKRITYEVIKISRKFFTKIPLTYQIFIHYSHNGYFYLENYELETKKLKPRREGNLELTYLDDYFPLLSMKSLFEHHFEEYDGMNREELFLYNFISEVCMKPKFEKLNAVNYEDLLSKLIEIEELECSKCLAKYDKDYQKIEFVFGNYVLMVENLSQTRPSVVVNDEVLLTPMNSYGKYENERIKGVITDTEVDRVIIEFDSNFKLDVNKLYKVQFMINRYTIRMEKNALQLSKIYQISSLMFPSKHESPIQKYNENFDYFNESIKTNLEQQIAVKSIFYGTAHPLPYIIFGPPGTGKTTTVVESILQLWKKAPNTRILVASSSNAACNEVAIRLLKYVPNYQVLRLFAKSQKRGSDKLDKNIIESSNLDEHQHYFPSIEEIYEYRIVLATLSTTGKLVQGSCKAYHFTHLFIDECGSSTETSSLIPITGLLSGYKQFTGNIILSGDPLQLGPVIHSKMAEKLNFGLSLLERLTNLDIYKKNAETQNYNNNIIIKLKQNYRSHPSLLHLSNTMFYDDELIPMAPNDLVNWSLGWEYLVNRDFPMLFHVVFGRAQKEAGSPSWFNLKEIDHVMNYLKRLIDKTINNKYITEADIGIISPYRKQCQKIRDRCHKKKWKKIEVGSVEAFQGCEKSIIILSTVRAKSNTIGFLDNPKRLNVALTRAKGLLILIGDPNVLKLDEHWRKVIEYCINNNSVTGESFKL